MVHLEQTAEAREGIFTGYSRGGPCSSAGTSPSPSFPAPALALYPLPLPRPLPLPLPNIAACEGGPEALYQLLLGSKQWLAIMGAN